MPPDPGLLERLRDVFEIREAVVERRLFGGVAFMVGGHMCGGVTGDRLMLRVGPDGAVDALRRPHVREMDFTGRPLRGMVYVEPEGRAEDEELREWIDRGLALVATLPPRP